MKPVPDRVLDLPLHRRVRGKVVVEARVDGRAAVVGDGLRGVVDTAAAVLVVEEAVVLLREEEVRLEVRLVGAV
jgi:hypothetical protein